MYEELSKFYDLFMSDIDYKSWADYIANKVGDRKSGVDLCCGSGKITIELKKRGYDIIGIDSSTQMLDKAVFNSIKAGIKTEFVNQDINKLGLIKNVDFMVSICDGINYIKNTESVFKKIHSHLNESGIFIFDISSEYKFKKILQNNTFSQSHDDITYIWNNSLDEKKGLIFMELTFFIKEGEMYRKKTETQIQYIHNKEKIMKELESANFKKIRAFTAFKDKNVRDTDERILFIAEK